ncbi:hypothetical protein DY000_02033540 [Brassica cretica]|uniref:Uncharacterized protein n=1 Tax=Brassica cretica TaxID=69181 RepID=A0ABQ7DDB3_BRACR|nr:hypothetical protein DY000_02033540 [Brassica cretica]
MRFSLEGLKLFLETYKSSTYLEAGMFVAMRRRCASARLILRTWLISVNRLVIGWSYQDFTANKDQRFANVREEDDDFSPYFG